jgi:hypothetical protein
MNFGIKLSLIFPDYTAAFHVSHGGFTEYCINKILKHLPPDNRKQYMYWYSGLVMILKNLLLSTTIPKAADRIHPRKHCAKEISARRSGAGKWNLPGYARFAPFNA